MNLQQKRKARAGKIAFALDSVSMGLAKISATVPEPSMVAQLGVVITVLQVASWALRAYGMI